MPRLLRSSRPASGRDATVYVTLEPCAHESPRGPACTELLLGPSRNGWWSRSDPDPRTSGKGIARLRKAGIEVTLGVGREAARQSIAGLLTRIGAGRPRVTLKLALSIDGKIALPSGEANGSPARTRAATSTWSAPTAT